MVPSGAKSSTTPSTRSGPAHSTKASHAAGNVSSSCDNCEPISRPNRNPAAASKPAIRTPPTSKATPRRIGKNLHSASTAACRITAAIIAANSSIITSRNCHINSAPATRAIAITIRLAKWEWLALIERAMRFQSCTISLSILPRYCLS